MKYFSLNCVKNAYELVSANTKDKFWGILGILYSIDSLARPGVNFSINTEKLSNFLEQTFRLKDKKAYSAPSSEYSVVFANDWEEKTTDNFIVNTPDIMPIIIWAYRSFAFDRELNSHELFEKFIRDFHLSKDSAEKFFNIKFDGIVIEYSDNEYDDVDLFNKLGGNQAPDAATIKMNKSFVVANAGDLSRGPFFQPLYASLNTLECLIIFPFDAKKYYQVFTSVEKRPVEDIWAKASQIIYYGCPGSGKSHMVNKLVNSTFTKYLSSKGLSDSSCSKYVNVLTTQWVVDIAKQCTTEKIESLYDISDIEIINKVFNDKVFKEKDDKGQRMYSTALKHYIDYLDTKKYIFRTTFHPDTDYASFVGCYKPMAEGHNGNYRFKSLQDLKAEANIINSSSGDKVSQIVAFVTKYANDLQYIVDTDPNIKSLQNLLNKNLSFANETYLAYVVDYVLKNQETRITYKFCPQVFTNAYIKAWEDTSKPVYLIIEEINRGNCAHIFGDLFQLLDRDKITGKSEYPIKADKDLVAHIEKVLGAGHEGIKNGELCLPSNLIIYATMNTSDQSLFPMDSAFKRRWDWEYVPIEYGEKKSNREDNDSYNFKIKIDNNEYKWIKFLRKVNDKIYDTTLSEDKQMGNYFIKGDVDELQFVNKVMFYLWNEVCKEEYKTQRNFFRKGKAKDNEECQEFKFVDLFTAEEGKNIEQTRVDILTQFMAHLEVAPEPEPKGENSEPKNNEQPAEQ